MTTVMEILRFAAEHGWTLSTVLLGIPRLIRAGILVDLVYRDDGRRLQRYRAATGREPALGSAGGA